MSHRFSPHRRPRPPAEQDPAPRVGVLTVFRDGVAQGSYGPDDDGADLLERAASPEHGEDMVTMAFDRPSPEELADVATRLDLPPLLTEDLIHTRQRPKVERHDDALFVVMKSAGYVDEAEDVVLTELHVVIRRHAVLVVRHGSEGSTAPVPDVPREVLALGPEAALYAVLDQVVDGYSPVLDEIELDLDQIERQVFTGDDAAPERIYRLSGEVIDLKHAIVPLREVVLRLQRGIAQEAVPAPLQQYLQDVEDHLRRATDRVVEISSGLDRIMTVNATLVGQRQNEDMKRISSWAAILFTPTLVAAIYGMNFAVMPELDWRWGYPASIALMLALGLGLFWAFKRRGWL